MVVQTTPRTIKMAFQKIPANRIPSARKCAMALQAISHQQTITEIANWLQVSIECCLAQLICNANKLARPNMKAGAMLLTNIRRDSA